MSTPLLRAVALTKEFSIQNTRQKLKAVKSVSFDLFEGEVLGIVGESGSGKTTLGRCAFGVITPTSGQIELCGENLLNQSRGKSKILRRNFGFVYQDPQSSINPRLTIGEVIAEPLYLRGDKSVEIERRIAFLIDKVGLTNNQLSKKSFELSGGQCQRVAIARAISTNPKVVLLDEPTSALDLSVQAQILNLLDDLRVEFKLSYLMISHNLDVVSHFSDRVAVMKDGEFLEVGTKVEMFRKPSHPYTRELIKAHGSEPKETNPLPRTFNLDTWQDGPTNRWAFQNIEVFLPVALISSSREIRYFSKGEAIELSEYSAAFEAKKVNLKSILDETDTDALVVLKDGTIRAELYQNGMKPDTPHLLQSVSKSILGTLFGKFISKGIIDPTQSISNYVPELIDSGFGNATIQQALDMTLALKFSEDYANPESEIANLDRACGWRTSRNGKESLASFLPSIQNAGEHGREFQYCSANTDVLAWTLSRVTGSAYAALVRDEIWIPLGTEHQANITIDSNGLSVANGGISATARDLARFGQMVLDQGKANGKQIIPKEWIANTFSGNDNKIVYPDYLRTLHPSGSYKNQWWVTGSPAREIYAVGIYGQYIWIDPSSRTVIVKLSSIPTAIDPKLSRIHMSLFRTLSAIE